MTDWGWVETRWIQNVLRIIITGTNEITKSHCCPLVRKNYVNCLRGIRWHAKGIWTLFFEDLKRQCWLTTTSFMLFFSFSFEKYWHHMLKNPSMALLNNWTMLCIWYHTIIYVFICCILIDKLYTILLNI